MTNAAERVLDAESAANALVAELERLKSAAEALETAHADSEQATRAAQEVVTTLNDVMPAVARVNEQLQALDLPALAERLAGEISASGMELTQRLAGEIRAVTEPVNQAVARLESLPADVAAVQDAQARVEPAIQELDGKAESLLQKAAEAAEQRERSGAQVQRSLAKLEPVPAGIAAVQDAQTRSEQKLAANNQAALAIIESLTQQIGQRDESQAQALRRLVAAVQEAQAGIGQKLAENSQATLTAIESLTQQIGRRGEAQAQELRRLTWKLAGGMIVGLVALAVFLWLTGTG